MNLVKRTFRFYIDGFKSMTLGRTLWAIIGIKLFIMFAVIRVFFYPTPEVDQYKSEQEKANFYYKQYSR